MQMNLESQVTSLELSKRLCELGIKQESFLYWCKHEGNDNYKLLPYLPDKEYMQNEAYIYSGGCGCCADYLDIKEVYSAYTASELGEMIFADMKDMKEEQLDTAIDVRKRLVDASNFFESESEVDVRAKMLIYLIESGVHKP